MSTKTNDLSFNKRLLWLIIFSIAMGFLEGAVVIYLRELYYPQGFSFPLVLMNNSIALVELLREISTVIMLLGIAMLGGRTASERLAHFLLSFAIWDFFYYVFLKLALDWPLSMMEWDILFLVPVPWIGPVITPVIVTITMTIFAIGLLKRDKMFSPREWVLIISGSLVVVLSWTIDFQLYASETGDSLKAASSYVPQHYPWGIFALGELILLTAIFLFWKRTQS